MLRRFFSSIGHFFRDNFLAGLFIAVPFAITIGFLIWVWSKINGPLEKFFNITTRPDSESMPWYTVSEAIQNSEYSKLIVPLLGLCILLVAVLLIGIIMRSIIGRMALAAVENGVTHLPIIGVLYTSVKQLGEAFISKDGHSKFERAVAVQFPYKGVWAIGFVTGKAEKILTFPPAASGVPEAKVMVFVPTTPLPTAGFLLMVPESETIALEMTVQEALRLVVSGGIIGPGDSQKMKKAGRITQIIVKEASWKRS